MQPTILGWREWIALPELGIDRIKAKLDSGARTSALHAVRVRVLEDNGQPQVSFSVHPRQRSATPTVDVTVPLAGYRTVVSSNGISERRPVIRTAIRLDGRRYQIDITLTKRDEMGFRLLLGRSALRKRFVIDPGRSFLGQEKT